jgi:hypothetical protein
MRLPGTELLICLLAAVCAGTGWPCRAVETNGVSAAGRYAEAYQLELGAGDMGDAASRYRKLVDEMRASAPALAAKALFRLAACERKQGHITEAKEDWKRLAEMLPSDHPLVVRANDEIKDIERELNRVTLQGRVLNAARQALPGICVLAGDWGHTPPAATGENGEFRVERRVAGRTASGARYCLVYAEHPFAPLAAATVAVEKDGQWAVGPAAQEGKGGRAAERTEDVQKHGAAPFDLVLREPFALSGYVVDPNGRPVGGALIRVTGFTGHARDIPMPFSSLLPAVLSGSDGKFTIDGLVPGLRYLVVAERDGYRLVHGTEVPGDRPMPGGGRVPQGGDDIAVVHVSEIVLQPIGRMFIDDQGLLRAEVNLNDPVERGRLEDMMRRFEESKAGSSSEAPRDGASESIRPFPFAAFPFSLHWLRGDPATGAALTREDLGHRVTVLHFRSAYLDASLRSQFPGEMGPLAHVAKWYGPKGVLCAWIVPAADDSDEAQRLALETYADIPIAVDREGKLWQALGVSGYGGNIVIDGKGMARGLCTDQQLLRMVKAVLAGQQGGR